MGNQAQPWTDDEPQDPDRSTYEPTAEEEIPNIPGVTPADDPEAES